MNRIAVSLAAFVGLMAGTVLVGAAHHLVALPITSPVSQEGPPPPPVDGFRRQESGQRPEGGGFRTQMPKFEDMDKNKDGKISKDEWQGPAQLFDRIDENHDGFIDKEEWARFQSRMAGGGRFGEVLMKFLDANGDGKISRDEFARLLQLFDALDKDHDGFISKEELGKFFQALSEVQNQATGGVEVDNLFQKYDKNKDGKITAEELGNEKLFKALDLNHDGSITREEAAIALKQLAERSKQKKESGNQ
jgi:Ca2+-binding EF-hand superfamily protein